MSSLHCLTYNISISSQLDKEVGSEADFVRECRRTKTDCFKNALRVIGSVGSTLDVLALQEVERVDIDRSMRSLHPQLDEHFRGCIWDADWTTVLHIMMFWNSQKLGRRVWQSTFELDPGRICLQVVVKKGKKHTLLMSVAAPHMTKVHHKRSLEKKLNEHFPNDIDEVIVLGDFNDHGAFIHRNAPLWLGSFELSQGLTREYIKKHLISCCWHEVGHERPHFSDPGDYVLARRVLKQRVVETPLLASDHMPVEAWVFIDEKQ